MSIFIHTPRNLLSWWEFAGSTKICILNTDATVNLRMDTRSINDFPLHFRWKRSTKVNFIHAQASILCNDSSAMDSNYEAPIGKQVRRPLNHMDSPNSLFRKCKQWPNYSEPESFTQCYFSSSFVEIFIFLHSDVLFQYLVNLIFWNNIITVENSWLSAMNHQ